MQLSPPDPQLFSHIRILISLVVGLGLTRLLSGVSRIIQHPAGKPVYWVHLGWVLFVFVSLVQFWWWEFRLGHLVQHWHFIYYLYIIVYVTLYFLACTLLFPDNLDEYSGYRDYFMSRRKWFFGFLAAIFVVDMGDTLIKGHAYFDSLGVEYPLRNITYVGVCLVAMKTQNARFHAAFIVAALVYQFSWILRIYETIA